jgi:subtilisin family serine protease
LRIRGKLGIGAVVVGMVFAIAPAAAEGTPPRGPAKSLPQKTITLVTGDTVGYRGEEARSVTPGPGRDGMEFSVQRNDDHLYVIPADAMPRVARGEVDRRLFDITTLTEFGYDRRDTVPLIVTGDTARPRGATTLSSIGGYATNARKGVDWRTLTTTRGVSRIWLDGRREVLLDHSVPQIGAPAAWAAGYTGAGTTVAVIDTGVDQTHPDLADRETAERNFTDSPDNVDHFGHGTHVASTVAGTGAKSGGKYRGVASGASILDAKVLDDNGFGQESWVIAGMEWAARQGADVANLSLGGSDTPEIDPLEAAVNSLSEEYGTLFVIAAGNSGSDASIGSPGSADAALTVGAVDRDDALAEFSSRGPRTGDGAIKPDVTAPGVDIVAALHSDGTINDPVEPGYTALSGTSMATPHVAGAAALLKQQHPDYTGAQLKGLLSASAKPTAGLNAFAQGSGRIDVARAITQSVVSEPTSVSIGTIAWPHDDDVAVSKPLSYRNLGATDVTLALALDTTAPAGMFSLSDTEITVPAGGTAEVTVTGDATVGTADGYFSTTVLATAGTSVTRTPVALDREVESYDLTIDTVDDTGAAADNYLLTVYGLNTFAFAFLYDDDGSVQTRLPKDTYVVDNSIMTTNGAESRIALVVAPNVLLDRDTTLTADARTARPIDITPPVGAHLALADLGYSITDSLGTAFLTDDLSAVSTAHLGAPVPGTGFTAKINTQWTDEAGAFYGLTWFSHGRMPTGFTKVVAKRDLATARVDLGTQTPDRTGGKLRFASPTEGDGFVFGQEFPVSLPSTRTEYLTTEGVRWQSVVTQYDGENPEVEQWSPYYDYRAGRTYGERQNYAVFGPSMPYTGFDGGSMFRYGNELYVTPAMFGDSTGGEGHSLTDGYTTELYRDGVPVDGEDGRFAVPPGDAGYRAVVTTTRPADVFGLSTAVSAEWTFRSAFVDELAPVPAPVSALRFTPTLAADNSARAGRPFLIPLSLQHNATGATSRPRTLSVDVSYDEGATWHRAPTPLNLVAVVNHPKGADSVSLRATATDRDGNQVKETIIRAYTLRK